MANLVRLGRILLGVAMAALGGLGLAFADFVLEWTAVPAHLPARSAVAYVHAALLIAAGLGLLFSSSVRPAALVLGVIWLLWTLLHIPLTFSNWRAGIGVQFELLAITSGMFLLAALAQGGPRKSAAVILPRYAFAFCLPVFGIVHFLYPEGVASWVPRWLPAHLFWAYFTGIAHCAAGFSLASGVLRKLAARLFAIMLSSWVLIVHIPRVSAALHDRHEWTTLFVAVVLSGIAWIVAGSLEEPVTQADKIAISMKTAPL